MSVLGVPRPIAIVGVLSIAVLACSSPGRALSAESATPENPEARADSNTLPGDECTRPSGPYLVNGAAAGADCPPDGPPFGGLIEPTQVGAKPPSGGPPGILLLDEFVGLSGGVFLSSDGSVRLRFPPGAVPSESIVRVTGVDTAASPPPRPPLATRAGETVLYVGLTTLDGRPVPVLLRDVELCVRYTTGDLDAGDGEASRLSLGRFDEGSLRWDVPRNELADSEGMVCATTLRLSVWTFLAEAGDAGWPGLGWWWAPVVGGGVAVGGGTVALLMRRRKPATHDNGPERTHETPISGPPVPPPRHDPQGETLDQTQAPGSESSMAERDVADVASEAQVDYAARASSTLQDLHERIWMKSNHRPRL